MGGPRRGTILRLVFAAAFALLALLVAPGVARADRVAVLPFVSTGGATSINLDHVRATTRAAATQLKHELPTDSQMLTAEMASKGGSDTTAMYRAAGRAATADWTVLGRVGVHAGGAYRIELEVCQVDSGRTESVAREIDPTKEVPQIAEMLALLLRPQGIGNDIPWDQTPPVVVQPGKPPPEAKPPLITPPQPPPPEPPGPPPVAHAYAEGHPMAIGISTSVLSAVHRAPNAFGSATSVLVGGAFGYALDSVPGLELRGNVNGSLVGPGSFSGDVGARYALPIAPTMRLFAGPELGAGTFVALGGEKLARFLMRGALVGALGLGDRVQLELGADVDYAPGGTTALLLIGGPARGLVRF